MEMNKKCSSKHTCLLDQLMSYGTFPKDFTGVLDDLTTADMDAWCEGKKNKESPPK